MNQALPSTIESKNRLWAAIGGPIGLWSTLTRSGFELGWVLAGKFTLMGANAAVMLFLAERLDLQIYGLLVVTISGQLLISRCLLVGVDTGMIRLSAIPELRSREREVVTAGLLIIASMSAILLGVSLFSMTQLSPFGLPVWVVGCIVVGSIGTTLVDYGYAFRLAHLQYRLAALAQGGTGLLRLAATIIAIVAAANPVVVFLAYHGASLCSGLIQTLFIANSSWLRPDKPLIKRLLRYSLWQGKANVVVIFSLYQGTFLLMMLNEQAETGIFGLALTLSLGFFAIYNAYGDYLLARIRSVEHISALRSFIRHSLLVGFFLIVACVPVVFVLARLLPWFLGPEWLEVVPVFVYLAASMLLLILQAPLEATCHYLMKPHVVTLGWAVRAVCIGIAGVTLASMTMKATGVAIGQMLGAALGLVVLSYIVAAKLRAATKVENPLLHPQSNS